MTTSTSFPIHYSVIIPLFYIIIKQAKYPVYSQDRVILYILPITDILVKLTVFYECIISEGLVV
jgi:hypothetical protein